MNEDLNKVIESVKGKVQEILDKTDVDDKLIDKAKGLKDKAGDAVEGALDKTDIDDKIKAKADEVLDKTDIDEKIKDKIDNLK